MYSVYALLDPTTNEIKYIGQTNNLEKRYEQHLRPISLKNIWIHELRWKSQKPKLEILQKCSSEKMAIARERHWIKFYRSKKNDLLNGKYLLPKKRYRGIENSKVVAEDLKTEYEFAKIKNDLSLMDEIIFQLHYRGWIPAIRNPKRTVWTPGGSPSN